MILGIASPVRTVSFAILLMATATGSVFAQKSSLVAEQSAQVGRTASFEQVVIGGPELTVKPIDDTTPVVVRLKNSFPHGTAFRYDIEAYAVEAGRYNLLDYLQPIEGAERADVAPVHVAPIYLTVKSTLAADEIEPETLRLGKSPWLGGYKILLTIASVLWLGGLAWLLGIGRTGDPSDAQVESPMVTTAQRLRPLVQSAVAGNLSADRHSILERLLLTHWRERLDLVQTDPVESLVTLRKHPEAGELLRALEDWLHRPDPELGVDIEALLRPYEDLEDAKPTCDEDSHAYSKEPIA